MDPAGVNECWSDVPTRICCTFNFCPGQGFPIGLPIGQGLLIVDGLPIGHK